MDLLVLKVLHQDRRGAVGSGLEGSQILEGVLIIDQSGTPQMHEDRDKPGVISDPDRNPLLGRTLCIGPIAELNRHVVRAGSSPQTNGGSLNPI